MTFADSSLRQQLDKITRARSFGQDISSQAPISSFSSIQSDPDLSWQSKPSAEARFEESEEKIQEIEKLIGTAEVHDGGEVPQL